MPLTGLRALLQGSSRYSIRMSSAGSIEQAFVQLEDGIQRLTLPLPTGPKHVHCYLAHGTLFDTGLGSRGPWDSTGRIASRSPISTRTTSRRAGGGTATGVPVFQGGLDYAQCERSGEAATGRADRGLVRPTRSACAVVEDLIAQGHAFAPSSVTRSTRSCCTKAARSEVAGPRAARSCRRHLGFLRDGVLIGATTCCGGSRRLSVSIRESPGPARRLPRLARAHDRPGASYGLSRHGERSMTRHAGSRADRASPDQVGRPCGSARARTRTATRSLAVFGGS